MTTPAAEPVAAPLTPLTLSERVAVGEDFFVRTWNVALLGAVVLAGLAVILALAGRDTAPTGTIVVALLICAGAGAGRGRRGYAWLRRYRYAPVLAGPLVAISSLWPVVDANAVYFPALAPLAFVACVAQRRRERVAAIVSIASGTLVAALLAERSPQLGAASNLIPSTIGAIALGVLLGIIVDWCARRVLLAPEDLGEAQPARRPEFGRPRERPPAPELVERERLEQVHAIRDASRAQLLGLRPDSLAELTARELQILFLLAEGLNANDIADCLGIAPKTVDKHVEHIRAKAGLILSGKPTTWLTLQLPSFGRRDRATDEPEPRRSA